MLSAYQADKVNGVEELETGLEAIVRSHLPSRHAFFNLLKKASASSLLTAERLGALYLNYQAAMHSTRVMVYFLPHLDAPYLRKAKLKVFVDDDGLQNGDTHHYQLARAFRNIGAEMILEDEDFGGLEKLCKSVTPGTVRFIKSTQKLYPKTLGAWTIVEMLSDNWMHALADALSVHFPKIKEESYFKDCFEGKVEEEHGKAALNLAKLTVQANPHLVQETLEDARLMAIELDLLWSSLEQIFN